VPLQTKGKLRLQQFDRLEAEVSQMLLHLLVKSSIQGNFTDQVILGPNASVLSFFLVVK